MKFASFLTAHAASMGNKDAVICGNRRLSFAELNSSTNRLAQGLRSAGVKVGDRVCIYLPSGVEFVQAFIAVVKAGAVTVPVNLPLSVPEISHILADSKPSAAFISAVTADAFARASEGIEGIRTIAVDDAGPAGMEALIAASPDQLPDVPFDFDDCMIGYTSGTTGRAKGVILTQSNYAFVNGYLNGYHWGLTARDRQISTTPLAHRTGFARVMNMILHGCTLVIMPRFDAAEAARLIEQESISVLGMVPTVGRMLLPEIEAHPERFASLRVMLATGEAFPVDVKQRLQAALPQIRLYSFYAMTEAGAIAGLDASQQITHAASVGRPWPGVDVKLMSTDGQQVATGEVGEVWVRSGVPGLYSTMRGYLNRPQETAETIRDGWLATGDMGRFDAEGFLYLVDRKKDMVLSGGYNIYSKEVEAALYEHPDIVDAAVIGVPDPVFGEAVAAYVELRAGAAADAEAIIAHCRDRIASYKKPRHVFFLPGLPRNTTGKVLKTRLREMYQALDPQQQAPAPGAQPPKD
ncbi:class I adenylate-forming enzyme family protein [Lacisediminimonas sp.]|uniref:class I adenylate-forming enzyme family protein n=1 Tax=Lacisediminimonas sp. TaxID=3060582 RepID=UPI0027278E0C|nr:class I adenylate-forming enzyme family protein [Lacisediminimonas sp.]MDO8300964.1 class I adenylate-forming enzyme family protein [Lacisediminimonas sp.]